ncbi:hypothetical protein SMICM304S_09933 [Streptomyces microflavus]
MIACRGLVEPQRRGQGIRCETGNRRAAVRGTGGATATGAHTCSGKASRPDEPESEDLLAPAPRTGAREPYDGLLRLGPETPRSSVLSKATPAPIRPAALLVAGLVLLTACGGGSTAPSADGGDKAERLSAHPQ